MHIPQVYFLTRKQYRDLTGDSRQSVQNKIKRGTLRVVKRKVESDQEFIELTPDEFDHISPKTQPVIVDGVHVQE